MAQHLNIREEQIEGILVVTTVGRLDLAGYPDFKAKLEALEGAEVSRVVMNMSGVDFISSSGMGALMNFAQSRQRTGGCVIVAEPSPACLHLIDTLQLREIIHVERSQAAAVQAARDSGAQ